MQAVGLGDTRMWTDNAQKSPPTLLGILPEVAQEVTPHIMKASLCVYLQTL